MVIGKEGSSDRWFYSLSDPLAPSRSVGGMATRGPGTEGGHQPECVYENEIFQSVSPNHRPEISSYVWFHGDLNREESQAKLLSRHKDGMYVVRNSSHQSFRYCLSVYFSTKVYHIPIRMEDGMFSLGDKRHHNPNFSCVPDLIAHFQQFPLFLKRDKSLQTNLLLALPK
ncbi:ras GTPase-activating protein 1-like isoform X2 [Liolophura sinensis]|uniref:ras GTPase-activating protein 1-like isoform X2 n=1 Tax=Liolophura sinensis TaxID=3198878 RepID=UPI0031597822